MQDSKAQQVRWNDMPMEELAGSVRRRFVYGKELMIAQIEMKADARVPLHHHHNEQVTNVMTGRVQFRFGADESDVRMVGAGETVIIPSNLPHAVTCLEDSTMIELFSPPRQDWIDGTDGYLRDQG